MTIITRTSATVTPVASSATNVTLFASNPNIKNRSVCNDSTQVLKLKFGANAAAGNYTVQVPANGGVFVFPNPVYTGQVDGIWALANGNALCTEWQPGRAAERTSGEWEWGRRRS